MTPEIIARLVAELGNVVLELVRRGASGTEHEERVRAILGDELPGERVERELATRLAERGPS